MYNLPLKIGDFFFFCKKEITLLNSNSNFCGGEELNPFSVPSGLGIFLTNMVQRSDKCILAEFTQRFWGSFLSNPLFQGVHAYFSALLMVLNSVPWLQQPARTLATGGVRQKDKFHPGHFPLLRTNSAPLQVLPAFEHAPGPPNSCFSFIFNPVSIMVICRGNNLI